MYKDVTLEQEKECDLLIYMYFKINKNKLFEVVLMQIQLDRNNNNY